MPLVACWPPGRPRLGWQGCGCASPRRYAPCAPHRAFPLTRPTSPSGGAPAKRGQTTRRGGRGPGGGRGPCPGSWSGRGRTWTCGGGGGGGAWGSRSGGGGGWGWRTGTGGEGNGRGRWTWGGGGALGGVRGSASGGGGGWGWWMGMGGGGNGEPGGACGGRGRWTWGGGGVPCGVRGSGSGGGGGWGWGSCMAGGGRGRWTWGGNGARGGAQGGRERRERGLGGSWWHLGERERARVGGPGAVAVFGVFAPWASVPCGGGAGAPPFAGPGLIARVGPVRRRQRVLEGFAWCRLVLGGGGVPRCLWILHVGVWWRQRLVVWVE